MYPVTVFPRFLREPARTKQNLTQDTGALFLLPNPAISWGFPKAPGDFPVGSYRKLLQPTSGIIDLRYIYLIINNIYIYKKELVNTSFFTLSIFI